MQFSWPVNWMCIRPVLFASLLLLLFLLPDQCFVQGGGKGGGGKKRLGPVKHLFGVGIGYQKVVHYKPVLVFSKHHRRPKHKHRRPGWGGGGSASGKHGKGWPVVVQHHIYKSSQQQHHRHGGGSGGGGGHYQFPKRRKKSHLHHHQHRNGGWFQSYRGWGWKPSSRRNPPYHSPNHPHTQHHEPSGGGGYHHHAPPPPQDHSHSPAYHSPPPSDNNFVGGGEFEWSGAANPFGNPYGGPGIDYADEQGGYESEIQEKWNKHQHNKRPLTPLVFPGTTKANYQPSTALSASPAQAEGGSLPISGSEPDPGIGPPAPPIYPFEGSPKTDGNVANIRRDFLKTHLKNFREFQGYQHHNNPNNPEESHNDPMMRPPGPDYSTTDDNIIKNSENSPDIPYYDDYYNNPSDDKPLRNQPQHTQHERGDNPPPPNPPHYNYDDDVDDDGFNWSELNRKMMPHSGSLSHPTQTPIVYGTPAALPSNQNPVVAVGAHNVQSSMQVNSDISNAAPSPRQTTNLNTFFKPSPIMGEMGSGASFSDPGFFPSFNQFQKIRLDKKR